MMEGNNQNIKSSEDIDFELGVAGNSVNFSPDEENYPHNQTTSEAEEEEDQDVDDENENLNEKTIGDKSSKSARFNNQDKTDEITYIENVKQIPEKDYTQNNETYEKNYDRNKLPSDSKLNPETETKVQSLDPDEPKNGKANNGFSRKMKNKNQPL
ncbi:MAG: hypothetical protein ABI462_10980 [Ignavibacteria bacterium]